MVGGFTGGFAGAKVSIKLYEKMEARMEEQRLAMLQAQEQKVSYEDALETLGSTPEMSFCYIHEKQL